MCKQHRQAAESSFREREVVINSEQIVREIVDSLEEKQALDIRAFDVRGKSSVTDFYIVASGNSAPHLKALMSAASRHMKKSKVKKFRSSGESESGWVVIDFVDVVVHIFSPEARAYYAVEKLWDGSEKSDCDDSTQEHTE
ncbi:MAG: ribosome silencing factor [Kiritimatiellia bacterium]